MGAIDRAVDWAVSIANDNSHGYSQANRWGPDYDCSSLVIQAWENAGVPVKRGGATFTGNMRSVFLNCGFRDVTYSIGLSSGYGLEKGDVLLNDESHTAMYIGNGRVVHARSSEGNSIQGDQSGNEIRVQNYWNFPWKAVLRYREQSQQSGQEAGREEVLRKGCSGEAVRQLQRKLIEAGYDVGPDGADGEFGNNTFRAVVRFQEDHGLTVNGEAGKETLEAFPEYITVKDPEPEKQEKNRSLKLPELGTGSRGTEVVLLQAALNLWGYDCGTADGDYGPKTEAAVNRAREDFGLGRGSCDRKLWTALMRTEG